MAVLGCGVDRDYPSAHRELAARICERGMIVSEVRPGVEACTVEVSGAKPDRRRARGGRRGRGARTSGALITADFALEEGREVFACPGEITSALSAGTNALLKLGAAPLTTSADVLEALRAGCARRRRVDLGDAAQAVLAKLETPASIDELMRATGTVSAELRRR